MLTITKRAIVTLTAVSFALPAAATAASLHEHQGVNNGLVIAGITEEIVDTCPTLSVRRLRGMLYLRSLANMARDAGFSDEEIEAYVDDEEQEARLRAHAHRYLESKGAVEGNPETYCAVGRAEIAAGSRVGSFLREN